MHVSTAPLLSFDGLLKMYRMHDEMAESPTIAPRITLQGRTAARDLERDHLLDIGNEVGVCDMTPFGKPVVPEEYLTVATVLAAVPFMSSHVHRSPCASDTSRRHQSATSSAVGHSSSEIQKSSTSRIRQERQRSLQCSAISDARAACWRSCSRAERPARRPSRRHWHR